VQFAIFADLIAGKLIKLGSESSLKKALEKITVEKASVQFLGEKKNPNMVKEPNKSSSSSVVVPPKITIEDEIIKIKSKFKIEEGDEIIIREIYAETMTDKDLMDLIWANKDNQSFLNQTVAAQIRAQIIETYKNKGHVRKTRDEVYKGAGGIFDLLVLNIIRHAMYRE